jgi:hypothetical protein
MSTPQRHPVDSAVIELLAAELQKVWGGPRTPPPPRPAPPSVDDLANAADERWMRSRGFSLDSDPERYVAGEDAAGTDSAGPESD